MSKPQKITLLEGVLTLNFQIHSRVNFKHCFNIKLSKSGGIHNALKINAIAEGDGIICMVDCMTETRLGLTAAAHVISARPNIKFADLDGHLMLKEDPIIGGAQYNVGEINLPETPGHGADIDPDFLNLCECITSK